MKNQKGISTLVGIIIIVAILVIALGGVLTYQYLTAQKINVQPQVQSQKQNKNTENLTEETTSQPSITVTSPSKGEILQIGKTYTIKWNSNGIGNISIEMVNKSVKAYLETIVTNITNTGSFSWTIPAGDIDIDYVRNNNVIRITSAVYPYIFGQVDNISIVASSTQPSITSFLPNPVTVGLTVTVTGANLSGFEADKNLWIENNAGQKGIIYGASGSTDSMIKFTLAGSYCTTDNSYSGLPCSSYITITPGTYNIYALPWGNMSNKVSFSIVQ